MSVQKLRQTLKKQIISLEDSIDIAFVFIFTFLMGAFLSFLSHHKVNSPDSVASLALL